jgi:molybdate transport system regulatory protein
MRRRADKTPPEGLRLTGRLAVETEQGAFLGNTRIRLLEAIDAHGSISQAAKFVPLSYKAAWDAVETMNNLADRPLVTRATGGRNGGGTQLTDYGRQMVELYRALEAEYQSALERLTASMNEGAAGTLQEFRRLLKRMSMKTSARNQFTGTIAGLRAGEVD